MSKKNTKQFIDKKNAVTFQLVHRSQHDPLVADESAPQRVLVPVTKQNEKQASSSKAKKEGTKKYGVVFDEKYDYLKNLPDTQTLDNEWQETRRKSGSSDESVEENDHKITLPSSVFESNVEEKVGLLNKAAPNRGLNLNLDSDIIAALDDDFDFDDSGNELEDNFIELANKQLPPGECDEDSDEFGEEMDDFDDESFYKEFGIKPSECPFAKEETKSRFTEYSISSSVMKRNEQLSMLDDKFEKLYADYDENEVGPLDCEEIEGIIGINSERLLQISKEEEQEVENMAEVMKNRMSLQKEQLANLDDDCNIEPRNSLTLLCDKNKWDCESILGLYNNKDNLPKFIEERKNPRKIKINAKTGIPMDSTLHLKNVKIGNLPPEMKTSNNSENMNAPTKTTHQRKIDGEKETPEQRKQRKQLVKSERQERRKERKINLLAFKEEEKRQKKILLNKNQNIQGNRIL